MYQSIISGLLSISMVFAGRVEEVKMEYQANNDGEMMKEDVGLDYEDNYIKINGPPVNDKTPAKLIYHTTEGWTQYRQAGHCFMLTQGFEVFSTDMDNWFHGVDGAEAMKIGDYVLHNYSAAPFPIDREKIPQEMQDECDEIYPAVLVNSYQGSDAERKFNEMDGTFVGQFFGPKGQDKNGNSYRGYKNRSKRDIFTAVLGGLAVALPKVLDAL